MKNKLSILIAGIILIAAIAINFQGKLENNKFSGVNIYSLNAAFAVDPEYPHYGEYGRDLFDCSATFHVTGKGEVCYKGFCVDYDSTTDITISCTNCAWDCNTDGANNTCDPVSC